MDGERMSDQVYGNDTYAERVAHGTQPHPHADSNPELTGASNDGPDEDTSYERPRGYSQYRVLSEFEKEHFHPLNVTPDRPSSAFFRAGSEITSKLIFDSLRSDGIPANAVRCLARKPTGETMITFTNEEYCCKFLDNSAFFIRNHGYQRGYPAHPAGGELTFVTIYDAPFEMSDAARYRGALEALLYCVFPPQRYTARLPRCC